MSIERDEALYAERREWYRPEDVTKRCSRCRQEKTTSDFYADPRRASGVSHLCKDCKRIEDRERLARSPDARERRREINRAWRERNREAQNAAARRRYAENPEIKARAQERRSQSSHQRARYTLQDGVRRGKIVKPSACDRCQAPTAKDELDGHHYDYSKPLDVEWLCAKCHGLAHRVTEKTTGKIPRNWVRGERAPSAKLTADQVREIRRRHAEGGILQRDLAREYGIAPPTLRDIITGKNWKHIQEESHGTQ